MEWRWFGTREVREARAFAAAGGIAVHANIWKLRGLTAAHMLGPDEATLVAAGAEIGLTAAQLHRSNTLHYDLVGEWLERARERCKIAE